MKRLGPVTFAALALVGSLVGVALAQFSGASIVPGEESVLDGALITGGLEDSGSGTCSNADSVMYDANGVIGCPKLTDIAPQGTMFRPQPAFPGGTQTAANAVFCAGQDEVTITIDDYTLCEDDTVTITVINSNGSSTATILTESELGGNDWNAVTSNNQTATNLATQLNDGTPAGITATASSAVVRIVINANTCVVQLAESDGTCTTVSAGTLGAINMFTSSTAANYLIFDHTGAVVRIRSAAGNMILGSAGDLQFVAPGNDVFVNDDIRWCSGSSVDSCIAYNTTQTPDATLWGVGTDSRTIIVAEQADIANDWSKAQQTNPTLCVASSDSATDTDLLCLSHNQTDATIGSDGGDIILDAAGGDISTPDNIIATGTGTIGWSRVSAVDQACSTTCTNACVFGQNTATFAVVDCADTTADVCICAGAN